MATYTIKSYASAETDSVNVNQITNNSLDVGAFSKQVNEGYVFFDLSGLPENVEISKLTLKLKQKSGSYYRKTVRIIASVCSNYINPTSIKWSSKPSASAISGSIEISANETAERSIVINGNCGSYIINGILGIKLYAEDSSAGDNNAKGFYPSVTSTEAYKPELTVEYDVAPGIKVYINGQFVSKPVKVYINGTWKNAAVKHYDGNAWS